MEFLKCNKCGNMAIKITEGGCDLHCCGEPMEKLVPNTSDGAGEKHVPVIKVEGNKVTVTVGEVTHPMLDEHYINWVMLETKKGRQRVEFKPGEAPEAVFALADGDEAVAAYEYCNLHGLWKAEV